MGKSSQAANSQIADFKIVNGFRLVMKMWVDNDTVAGGTRALVET